MSYKLSLPAEKDVEKILSYTIETWGYSQFLKYKELMNDSLKLIGEDPEIPRSRGRDYLFPGCRSYKFGKHLIFYRIMEETTEVVRILHEKMDFESHLP